MTATSPITKVAIWGMGRVGTGFALALNNLPVSLYLFSTSKESRESATRMGLEVEASQDAWTERAKNADIVSFAWSDDAIPTAMRLCDFQPNTDQLVLHFSGLLNANAFGETKALKASLHPLAACSTPLVAQQVFRSGPLVVEGSTASIARLKPLTQSLGADVYYLNEGQKAHYHAGAVLGSNALIGLLHAALQEWDKAGLENAEPLMLSLARSALGAASDLGLRDGLTGPLKRADLGSLEQHLSTLGAERLTLYKLLSRQLIEVLGDSHFEPEMLTELQELLKKT